MIISSSLLLPLSWSFFKVWGSLIGDKPALIAFFLVSQCPSVLWTLAAHRPSWSEHSDYWGSSLGLCPTPSIRAPSLLLRAKDQQQWVDLRHRIACLSVSCSVLSRVLSLHCRCACARQSCIPVCRRQTLQGFLQEAMYSLSKRRATMWPVLSQTECDLKDHYRKRYTRRLLEFEICSCLHSFPAVAKWLGQPWQRVILWESSPQ